MLEYSKKIFTQNIGIKIFCLIISMALWVYVAAGQNTIAKYPGSIKIKAINIPSGLVAIYDIKTVDIKIMAEPTVWSKLSSDSFSACVDLSGQKEGTYELPVNVVSSTSGVDIVERTPDKIIISLEPIVTKEVSINKKIEGSAAEGLVAGNIDLVPTKTMIKGPKSVVGGITEATALIKLNGESEKFTKTIALTALDERGENISNIEFSPPEVVATVALVKASNNKTVGVKVKTTGSPKDGYFVSNITVTPGTVDITGSTALLSDVTYIETAAVDLSNQNFNFEKDISLTVKNGLALQIGSPAKVHIKVSLSQNVVTKEMRATVVPINLNSNYQIYQITPSDYKVICSGPSDLILSLQASQVVLNLDLNGKTPSSSPINFNLTPASIKTPDGISVVSVVPTSLSVTISPK